MESSSVLPLIVCIIGTIAFVMCLSTAIYLLLFNECNHEWERWLVQKDINYPRQKMVLCKKCGKCYIHTYGLEIVEEGLSLKFIHPDKLYDKAKPSADKDDLYIKFGLFDKSINPELIDKI